MKELRDRFPCADLLFGGYFHEDFLHPPPAAVRRFVLDQSNEVCKNLALELESILEESNDDHSIMEIVKGLGNCFDVLRSRSSYRAWLEEVIVIILSELKRLGRTITN